MTPEQVALMIYAVTQAIQAVQANIEAFQRVHGRAPTLEEYKALEAAWKSPDEIEAEVRARLTS